MLPNFLICGAAQSGTTFLASSLDQHPDVYLGSPMQPEPHYFYFSWKARRPLQWYEQKWFSDVCDETAVGEKSTSYMLGVNVARRIRKACPGMKLIFLLRNPVERAFSNYRFTVFQGLEPLGFVEALEREEQRTAELEGRWAEIRPYSYIARSLYGRQLERFCRHFPRSQMLILRSEDMYEDRMSILRRVFAFLDVGQDFEPSSPPRHSTPGVKDRELQVRLRSEYGQRFSRMATLVRKGGEVRSNLTSDEDLVLYDLFTGNLMEKQKMPTGAREYLREALTEDLQLLQDIVDFPVGQWF